MTSALALPLGPAARPGAAHRPVARATAPCLAAEDGAHCVAALLHGAACCPDGTCALCAAEQDRRRRRGEERRDAARTSRPECTGRPERCPVCGFSPPPALAEIPPLPRLDRSGVLQGSARCRYCDRKILGVRKRYCGRECWNAYVVWARRLRREVDPV